MIHGTGARILGIIPDFIGVIHGTGVVLATIGLGTMIRGIMIHGIIMAVSKVGTVAGIAAIIIRTDIGATEPMRLQEPVADLQIRGLT